MLRLRYFYLISLLICIELCFCYEYISEQNYNKINEKARRLSFKNGNRHKENLQDGRKSLKNIERRDPVAEIDVASFIQQPEYDSIEGDNSYNAIGQRDKSINYNDYGSLSGLEQEDARLKVSKDKLDYASLDIQDSGKFVNTELTLGNDVKLDENPTENVLIHKQQKKYSLKFPFFSRKKASTTKPKKGKKSKSCASCTKTTSLGSSPTERSFNTLDTQQDYKMFKRSYSEQLCPLCQKKLENKKSKKVKKKQSHHMFHNSKQYFQENHMPKNNQLDSKNVNYQLKSNAIENNPSDLRKKRETDAERQLKELEEVQKKIDSVDLATTNQQQNRFDNTNIYSNYVNVNNMKS